MQGTTLFLIRRYNDLDHITPIIWKMIMVSDMRPLVWIVSPDSLDRDDFRLVYLRELGVTVEFCYDGKIRRVWEWIRKHVDVQSSKKCLLFSRLVRRLVDWEDQKGLVTEATVRSLLNGSNVRAVVVDWQKPDRHCIPQILGAAKQVGVPIIAVPHGVPLQKSRLVTNRQMKRNRPPDYRFGSRFFDQVIVPHQHFKSRLVDSGIHPSRVTVIGSARYCDEWRSLLGKIARAEGQFLLKTPLKKVVYFDHQKRYRLEQSAILKGLTEIGRSPALCLVVRSSPDASMWAYRDILEREGIIFDTRAEARDLIYWSEVVVSTTSSLLLDVWLEKKRVVYPKHFHKVDMLFEDWKCGEVVQNDSEMIAALLADGGEKREEVLNEDREVRGFLDFVVCGGQPDRDVLAAYVSEIERAVERYGSAWN